MFKKIEIWILYLAILLGILFGLSFGVLVRQEIEGLTRIGSFDISFLSKPAAFLARLPERFAYTVLKGNPLLINDFWDEDRDFYAQDGFKGTFNQSESYLLLSRYDGDLKEGLVELIDLTNFQILHTWNPDIDKFNDLVEPAGEFKYLKRDSNNRRLRFLHPLLTNDGGLLIQNNTPLRKIDACSNLIFQNSTDLFHHSIETDFYGNIWVPSSLFPQSLSKERIGNAVMQDGGFVDDAIVQLSPDGKILYEKSVSQIFIENGLEYLLFSVGDMSHDIDPVHLNDIQPVKYDSKYWKKGDVFLSLRHQSMVLLYRPSTGKIIWKDAGRFFHQHDINILDDHRISIFNNNSKHFVNGDIVDGHNEVLIYDFKNNNYLSYLQKSFIEHDIRTVTEGRGQVLPNDDLFIEESNFARTLYFNSDGTLRWSHVNRAKDGNVYRVGWSRIIYNDDDIQSVKNFLISKDTCNE
ncbi:arylsulfotransferase family protein [Gammaproteobacteria bacterium]|nr:arylsulfotransferase family protein [Gammaproteobacteria bacterium]